MAGIVVKGDACRRWRLASEGRHVSSGVLGAFAAYCDDRYRFTFV